MGAPISRRGVLKTGAAAGVAAALGSPAGAAPAAAAPCILRHHFSVPEDEIKRMSPVLTVVGGENVPDTGEVT